jgi:DNA-binding cell septation regulator SpoVG
MSSNSNLRIAVTIRPASRPGSVKAHADARVDFASSTLEIFGISVIQHDLEKPAWVSYPQRQGKDAKKYFPVLKVTGALHEKISEAVLAEWERNPVPAADRGGVPRAQIPREPGDDSIPF